MVSTVLARPMGPTIARAAAGGASASPCLSQTPPRVTQNDDTLGEGLAPSKHQWFGNRGPPSEGRGCAQTCPWVQAATSLANASRSPKPVVAAA
jgi:hypothetical protein